MLIKQYKYELLFYALITIAFIAIIHLISKNTDLELLTIFSFTNSALLFFNLQIAINNQIKTIKSHY